MSTLNRRVALALAGMVLLSAAPLTAAGEPVSERPNVILILSDDQGFADVGIHGHPVLNTLNAVFEKLLPELPR